MGWHGFPPWKLPQTHQLAPDPLPGLSKQVGHDAGGALHNSDAKKNQLEDGMFYSIFILW